MLVVCKDAQRLGSTNEDVSSALCDSLQFDNTRSFDIDVKQAVGEAVAGFEREFAYRHSLCRVNVCVGYIAHMPTGCDQKAIDVFAGLCFQVWYRAHVAIIGWVQSTNSSNGAPLGTEVPVDPRQY